MKNYLISAILLLFVSKLTAQDWALELSSTVELRTLKLSNVAEKSDRGLGGATISLYQGSSVVKQVYSDANGDFVISIPPNGDYMLVVSYQDCNPKKFQISTKGVPADYTKDNFKPRFSIGGAIMARPLNTIDYSVLSQPLAKILFMTNSKKFDDDNNYTQQILSSLERIGEAEDALIEKFIGYAKAGDAALKKGDCPQAKINYENALSTIPGEQYPKDQLVKVGICLKEKDNAGKKAAEEAAAKAAQEKAAADKIATDKLAKEKAETEKLEAEKVAKEKAATDKANAEKLAKDKEAADKLAKEKAEAEKLETEKVAREKAAADKTNAEKLIKDKEAADKLAKEKIEADRLVKEKAAAEKANAEKLAKDKEAADKLAKEKTITDKAAADKAIAEKLVKDKEAADKLAKEKADADKAAADKAIADKLAKDKLEADKANANKLAKEKAEADKVLADKTAKEKVAKEEADNLSKKKQAEDEEAKKTAAKPPVEKEKEAPIVAKTSGADNSSDESGGKKGNSKHSIPTKLGGPTYRDAIIKADGYFKMKRYAEAKTAYEEALTLKAGDVYTTNKLADIERLTAPKQP